MHMPKVGTVVTRAILLVALSEQNRISRRPQTITHRNLTPAKHTGQYPTTRAQFFPQPSRGLLECFQIIWSAMEMEPRACCGNHYGACALEDFPLMEDHGVGHEKTKVTTPRLDSSSTLIIPWNL